MLHHLPGARLHEKISSVDLWFPGHQDTSYSCPLHFPAPNRCVPLVRLCCNLTILPLEIYILISPTAPFALLLPASAAAQHLVRRARLTRHLCRALRTRSAHRDRCNDFSTVLLTRAVLATPGTVSCVCRTEPLPLPAVSATPCTSACSQHITCSARSTGFSYSLPAMPEPSLAISFELKGAISLKCCARLIARTHCASQSSAVCDAARCGYKLTPLVKLAVSELAMVLLLESDIRSARYTHWPILYPLCRLAACRSAFAARYCAGPPAVNPDNVVHIRWLDLAYCFILFHTRNGSALRWNALL